MKLERNEIREFGKAGFVNRTSSTYRRFLGLPKFDKVFFSFILFVIIFSAASILIRSLSSAAFFLMSVMSIFILAYLFKYTLEVMGYTSKSFNKGLILLILVSISFIFALLIYYLSIQKTIKIWDFCVYWSNALILEKRFNASTITGIISIGGSILFSEYNRFLLLFTEVPFRILGPSITSWTLSYFFVGIVPLLAGFILLAKEMIKDTLGGDNSLFVLAACSIAVISLPMIYTAALKGMPDVFGLVFVIIILLCSYRYDYSRIEIKRLAVIGFSLVCLMLTRRWYAFWIVGYFCSTFAVIILIALQRKDFSLFKKILINIAKFGLILAVAVLVLFFPMVYKVATAHYSKYYVGYMLGGFSAELTYQLKRLGIVSSVIILMGGIFGLSHKNTRINTVFSIINYFIPLYLFTRIQNMGDHQSLILVPSYLSLLILGVISIYKITSKVRIAATALVCAYLILNLLTCMGVANPKLSNNLPLFSNMSLKPEIRTDLADIKDIADYIDKICDADNKIYIVSGSGDYNVDVFRNFRMPDISFRDKIYPETSVDLTHGFPVNLFAAKYVLVSDPLQYGMAVENSKVIEIIGNSITKERTVSSHYSEIKEFKVGNNLKYHLYELKTPLDDEAANFYLKEFNKYYSGYPELFENRIKSVMKN